MRTKTTGLLPFDADIATTGHRDPTLINVPACGLAAALGAKITAYAAGQWFTNNHKPTVTYNKHRHVAFDDIYVSLVTARRGIQTYSPSDIYV